MASTDIHPVKQEHLDRALALVREATTRVLGGGIDADLFLSSALIDIDDALDRAGSRIQPAAAHDAAERHVDVDGDGVMDLLREADDELTTAATSGLDAHLLMARAGLRKTLLSRS